MLVMGIDPGTKVTGIAIYGNNDLCTHGLKPHPKDILSVRIMDICDELNGLLLHHKVDVVCLEESTYRGRAENSFKRLLGAMEYVIMKSTAKPPRIMCVNPATLKKYYGHGALDKHQVAAAARHRLYSSKDKIVMDELITKKAWDQTDAVAIAIYGHDVMCNVVYKR